jgi:3-oxocholest-4-en-26-oyl-CoA dehydrogenase beta subunit
VDFSQTDEQQELAALTRRILTGKLTSERLAALGAGGAFDRELWAELGGAGILAAALPEPAGGAGLGFVEQCSVLTEIGRTVAPVPYLASVVLGASAIARFGTPDQQKRWAVPAAGGETVLAAALSEDEAGDPRAPATTAERLADGWLLSGTKTTVLAAPDASLLLVPAATPDGVAVFLAGPDDDGLTVQQQHVTGGAGAGRVTLSGVRLADERMLGAPGDGARVTDWLLSHGTVGLCALQLGVAERALEMTAGYARTREQFGRPIGSFQAVAQRLADAYIDVEAIRLTMWQAAWHLSTAPDGIGAAATEVATAKFWAADAGHRVAHTAVHIHGGMGIDTSYPVHRYFTAAAFNEFALGGATTQLRRIGATLAQRS